MSNVLLVVDMVKGFFDPKCPLYCGDAARDIIPVVRKLVESESKRGSEVFFVCDTHEEKDLEFEVFPPHCIRGTEESLLIDELAGLEGTRIDKMRFSAFFGTDLEQRLKLLSPEKIIVSGVCTNICVLHTVADARNRDYKVEIPIDSVADFDIDNHNWALRHMEDILGAKVIGVPVV